MIKYNLYWIEQENIFLKAIKKVKIPNYQLDKVDFIDIELSKDLNSIPDGGGCYWIWTNEPVNHVLHKNKLPVKINEGEIIYNGIAKDDVKGRVFHHLFGFEDAGWSGISLDIYKNPSLSHRKKAMSKKGKSSFILSERTCKRTTEKHKKGEKLPCHNKVETKDQLKQLHLSNDEIKYINNTDSNIFYFRNGINITEEKHKNFKYRVYFITGLNSLYLELIEKKWRENGLPKLCSYSSGR